MNDNESTLMEAIKSFLNDKAALGLAKPDKEAKDDSNPRLRGVQYLHEHINNLFAQKISDLEHYTGIRAAFAKIHAYKYINDSGFMEALGREMTAQGIPLRERNKVFAVMPAIIKDMQKEFDVDAESDYGFHPDLEEIMDIPAQYEGQ